MRTLVIALALSTACTAYAQTGCSSSSTSSSLPETSGCLPATFTPADGGPSRPVLLDVQFTNFQGGSAPTAPSAVKLRELAIGVFGSYDSPDYNSNGNIGVGAWATFTANHFGVQADAVDDIDSRGGVEERSIVVGPRYQVRRHGITLYAKAQAGAGHFTGAPVGEPNYKSTKVIEQYGGGIELNPTQHLKIRVADYSYQVWPEFSVNNLTPSVVSSGIAMRF